VPLTDNAGPAIKVAVRCAKCGTDNREGRRFCSKCGGALARSCPKRGTPNEAGDDFCGDCGASLTPSPAAQTEPAKAAEPAIRITSEAASASLEGERKTITALFADIKGSMELMEDLDPEEERAIIDPALKLMIDAAHRNDGYPQRALYENPRLHGCRALRTEQWSEFHASKKGVLARRPNPTSDVDLRISAEAGAFAFQTRSRRFRPF
jgi:double zinc ribbon protein